MVRKLHPKIKATIKNFIKHALSNKGAVNYETGVEPSDLLQMFFSVPKDERKHYGSGHAWTIRLPAVRLGSIVSEIPFVDSEKHYSHWEGRLVTRYYLSNSLKEN